MTTQERQHPWYHLTPDRFFIGLLVVQMLLFLSEKFQWFAFNERKGWTVLIAVGVVGVAFMLMLLWGLVCLCLRRPFQFGVRSLLLFMVTLSIPLGWFAWEMQRARRQREAVEAILGMSGKVAYDYEVDEKWKPVTGAQPAGPAWLRQLLGNDFFCTVVGVDCFLLVEFGDEEARCLLELTNLEKLLLGSTQITDNGVGHFKGMTQLEELLLSDTQITDDALGHLRKMTDLEHLSLVRTQITDNGLEQLTELTNLETLYLDGTQVSDNGLAHLKGMTKLERLSLSETQITDDGLGHLTGMTNLKVLSLVFTQISDNGLTHLKRMTKLKVLVLTNTQVTDHGIDNLRELTNLDQLRLDRTHVTHEGVEELREALPNCTIYHN